MLNLPSTACVALTQSFEHCSLTAYHGEEDPPDVWTIGWGETIGIRQGDVWTQEQADAALLNRLHAAALEVIRHVDVALSQGQLDALTDFIYNEGAHAFCTSTLQRRLNAGDYAGAAAQFLAWDFANGKPSDGLERRRRAEQALFTGNRATG